MFSDRKERMLLSYSRRHFSPLIKSSREFHSAGQLAKNLYSTFREDYKLYYYDYPFWIRKIDILFSPFIHKLLYISAKKKISFPVISHPAYTNQIIMEEAEKFGEDAPEYIMSNSELKSFEKGFNESDLLILIGNEYVKETYLQNGISNKKITLINSGIDYNHFYYKERNLNNPIFIHNGTKCCLNKGIHYVLDAWDEVIRNYPEAELWILGRENREKKWKEKLKKKNVIFHGSYSGGSKEYIELLNQGHYIVLPSLSEGQPGTVLEAMSCGCIPILFKSSGLDAEKYGGFEAEFRNKVSLAEKMIEAIKLKSDWKERSNYTRSIIKKYHSWPDFRKNIIEILASCK